ncbi:SKP1-interacting partner 15 [Coffea eugenioides]|uniref:SKP1-interacting partner 15 n=1 Tax=Coffea arabica TaxID=13443 RepID=A0A6P6URY5_COFAR|nr:SKP1-interacting partner 15 [Coffea arabica]XP_027148750.1 SKP1-interacting partner 15 [Coffea eugenioides]
MESSPLNRLPQDTLHQIFSSLPLRQMIICRAVCKSLYTALSSPSFLHLISSSQSHVLSLIALRPSHRSHSHSHLSSHPALHVFDPLSDRWFRFPLNFLPFPSLLPITSSRGLLYLWASSSSSSPNPGPISNKMLIVCNPLTRQFKALPQLGSAWSRHGSVLIGAGPSQVLVLTELATLYSTANSWLKYSSNLPSKPRSPVLIENFILALCDVGSPWRSQWKLFKSMVINRGDQLVQKWTRLEKHEWGDVFDIIKRPRLLVGGKNKVLMIGGLKSSYSLHSACSTILILRLDLESLEWDEAGRMPSEMYRLFQDSSKFKVFGGGNRVCFSAKRVGKLVVWECFEENGCEKTEWRWIDGVPGNGDGLCRGFLLEAQLSAVP